MEFDPYPDLEAMSYSELLVWTGNYFQRRIELGKGIIKALDLRARSLKDLWIPKLGDYRTKRNAADYEMWKRVVLSRDHNKCVVCDSTRKLEVHHLKAYSQYPELRLDVNNGVILCHECHMIVRDAERSLEREEQNVKLR